jgi:hypothetical protein
VSDEDDVGEEKLNSQQLSHFFPVSTCWREAFSLFSLIEAVRLGNFTICIVYFRKTLFFLDESHIPFGQ